MEDTTQDIPGNVRRTKRIKLVHRIRIGIPGCISTDPGWQALSPKKEKLRNFMVQGTERPF